MNLKTDRSVFFLFKENGTYNVGVQAVLPKKEKSGKYVFTGKLI